MPTYRHGRHEHGQNFLTDPATIRKIVGLVALTEGPILEIGPGDGALTLPLSRLERPLTAVEIDAHLADKVRSKLPRQVEVIQGDFLHHRQAHRPRYQRAIDQGGPHRDPSSPSNQPAPEVELPAGPLGEAARWVLDTLAADSGPTEEEIGQRFAPKALEAALAPVLTQAFAQVRAMGPYTVTMWEGFRPSGAPG